GQRTAAAGVAESLVQDGIERIKRIDHTFDRLIESASAVRHAFWPGHILTASVWSPFRLPVVNLRLSSTGRQRQRRFPGEFCPAVWERARFAPSRPVSFPCARGAGAEDVGPLGMRLRPRTLVGASAFVPKLADAPSLPSSAGAGQSHLLPGFAARAG